MGDLADLNQRTRSTSANINFSATNRQTRQLVQLDDVDFAFGGRQLFEKIQFSITSGMRVGLVGPTAAEKYAAAPIAWRTPACRRQDPESG